MKLFLFIDKQERYRLEGREARVSAADAISAVLQLKQVRDHCLVPRVAMRSVLRCDTFVLLPDTGLRLGRMIPALRKQCIYGLSFGTEK